MRDFYKEQYQRIRRRSFGGPLIWKHSYDTFNMAGNSFFFVFLLPKITANIEFQWMIQCMYFPFKRGNWVVWTNSWKTFFCGLNPKLLDSLLLFPVSLSPLLHQQAITRPWNQDFSKIIGKLRVIKSQFLSIYNVKSMHYIFYPKTTKLGWRAPFPTP